MAVCKCDVGLSNLGLPNCVPIAGVTKKIILLPYYDNDGNINSVDCADAFDEAYFVAKANDTADKRWQVTPEVKNVDDVKGDSIFESFNDASNLLVQEGTRTFNGVMPQQSPAFLGQLKGARCVQLGVFIIDKNGALIGSGIVEGKLQPFRVDNNTWNATLVKGTDTTLQKVMLSFEYSRLELDENIRMITADSFTFDLLNLQAVKDVNLTGLAVTLPSQIDFTAETIYGSQCALVKVQGLGDPTLTDFVVTVDGVPDAILSVTEASAGVYTIGITSVLVGGEVVVVTIAKDNFEVASGNTVTA